MLVSPVLEQLTWIEHGFGTRTDLHTQDGMAGLKQIHSARCVVATSSGCLEEGDALVTSRKGMAVSVRTADCYPILLADPASHSIAAIHAGWRGTAAGIVQRAVERMRSEFGAEARDLRAAIGPGIGVCCYQVGEEVAARFGRSSAGNIDLAEANRTQLLAAGLVEENIHCLGLCTFCDQQRFHSYRRDGSAAGRMISYIKVHNSYVRVHN